MNTIGVCLCAGLAAALALLIALHRKVDTLPLALWKLVQRDRAADEKRALDTLQEATAIKVGTIVRALRQHHDALEAQLRSEIAQAELRARLTERRSSDTGVALGAASALVATLRELVDDLPDLLARAALLNAGKLPPAPAVRAALASCPTIEPPPEAAAVGLRVAVEEGDRPSADEMTVVSKRPLPGAQALGSTVGPSGPRGAP
jgi:hypothetical protein